MGTLVTIVDKLDNKIEDEDKINNRNIYEDDDRPAFTSKNKG